MKSLLIYLHDYFTRFSIFACVKTNVILIKKNLKYCKTICETILQISCLSLLNYKNKTNQLCIFLCHQNSKVCGFHQNRIWLKAAQSNKFLNSTFYIIWLIHKHLRQFMQSDCFLPVFISHDKDTASGLRIDPFKRRVLFSYWK